ncbi:MAG: hypothetical protein H0V91_13320, partial [Flavisolibacter sp.]|nr:hypothetical protein [Flavisolibacter sp.]
MKSVLLIITFTVTAMFATAQTSIKNSNKGYDAASWATYFLDNANDITIAPPPGKVSSKTELKNIKQAVAKTDESKSKKIKYWDAGAPAYRWNQV